MSNPFRLPSPLYAILDPGQSQDRSPAYLLRQLLDGGARVIQLRMKEAPAREFLGLAAEARKETAAARCLLIVNDRVDIALACRADGVHLGQEDLPLRTARRLMGDRLIGISTHDLSQAVQAARGGADYIGVGPIFGTLTKETGYDPRGLSLLRRIRQAVAIPLVAIGGITEKRAPRVWEAGADSVAMISDLMKADEIALRVRGVLARHQNSSASST